MQPAPPYQVLAAGYDVVMEHVDYEGWADYVQALLRRYAPDARDVLELGCGTGSLALELQPMGPPPVGYRYVATDASPQMVSVARAKRDLFETDERPLPVQFDEGDFREAHATAAFDVALLLYDGLNYLTDEADVGRMLRAVRQALRPGGLFVVDQSTPANSENNEALFEDEGEAEGFRYRRRSRYDRARRLHTTTFEITVLGETYREEHVQRAYARAEVRALVEAAGFHVEAAFDEFTLTAATDRSERIHWVLRAPAADGGA